MKIKSLIFNLIALIAVALGCFAFSFVTPVYALVFNKKDSAISVSSPTTYYLYSNNNGASGPDDFFTLEADLSAYKDAGDISPEALYALRFAVTKGLINGNEEGTLKPKGSLSRAELAVILLRLSKTL